MNPLPSAVTRAQINAERRAAGPSRIELERRWALVRDYLKTTGQDVLIASADQNDLGGSVRWLTDGTIAYRKVVLFFADDLMTVVDHGGVGNRQTLDGDVPGHPGVSLLLSASQFPSVHFTQSQELDLVAGVLRSRGCRAIALHNPGAMPYRFLTGLRKALVDATFTDASEAIDRFKAIKSAEEIAMIRDGAAMHDAMFARLCREARPGMTDGQLVGILKAEGASRNGEFGIIMAGSAPPGRPALFGPDGRWARRTNPGDQVGILIEIAAPGGHFLELGRHITFGKAPAELLEAFDQAREAQAFTKSLLTPGARFADVFLAFNDYMVARGLPPEQRLYAHGQGYDLVERPLVRDDETMVVEAGMTITIHPGVPTASSFAFVCDNYLIGEDGLVEPLHRTEQKIFEL